MSAAHSLAFGLMFSLAATIADAAPAKDRDATAPHGNLDAGIAAYESRDFRMAVQQLEIAIVADPKNPEGYFRLSQAHRALGNYRRALKYVRLALAIEPNHLAALRERGVILLEAGQPADAKLALEQLGEKCGRACPEYESLKRQLAAAPVKKDG
jgi:tetratricopeptide (TPR) repeat protein